MKNQRKSKRETVGSIRKPRSHKGHEENNIMKTPFNKKFWEVQGTYSAVLRNIHGDDTSFEASYAVLALQMIRNAMRHAVGFFKRVLGCRRHRFVVILG
jgi:hypothetical protein